MITEKTVEEYLGTLWTELTPKETEISHSLWDILHTVERFTDEEAQTAETLYADDILEFSAKCGHMSKETLKKLQDYLDFIMDNEENGYLLDMVLDYFL